MITVSLDFYSLHFFQRHRPLLLIQMAWKQNTKYNQRYTPCIKTHKIHPKVHTWHEKHTKYIQRYTPAVKNTQNTTKGTTWHKKHEMQPKVHTPAMKNTQNTTKDTHTWHEKHKIQPKVHTCHEKHTKYNQRYTPGTKTHKTQPKVHTWRWNVTASEMAGYMVTYAKNLINTERLTVLASEGKRRRNRRRRPKVYNDLTKWQSLPASHVASERGCQWCCRGWHGEELFLVMANLMLKLSYLVFKGLSFLSGRNILQFFQQNPSIVIVSIFCVLQTCIYTLAQLR